jgi:hypothetical protein
MSGPNSDFRPALEPTLRAPSFRRSKKRRRLDLSARPCAGLAAAESLGDRHISENLQSHSLDCNSPVWTGAVLISYRREVRTMVEPVEPEPGKNNGPSAQATHSEDGVDLTLIRWMLSLTPAERLDVLQQHLRSTLRLRGEGNDL